MYSLNLVPGAAFISYIFFSPSCNTKDFLAELSLGKVLANQCNTYYNISGGASDIKGSKAGKQEHIYNILFNPFLAFFFKSSLLS